MLDLAELDFIDSTGLRLILELHGEAAQDGFTLALVPGGDAVQRVFDVTGTADVLPVHRGLKRYAMVVPGRLRVLHSFSALLVERFRGRTRVSRHGGYRSWARTVFRVR